MGFLSPDNRAEIQSLFESLKSDVRLIHFTQRKSPLIIPGQDCETCEDTRALLEEVAALSEKLKLEVHELTADNELAREHGIDRVPALVMVGEGIKGKVRYFGMPSGYEFSVLLGSLVDASQGKTDLSESSIEVLDTVGRSVHIQVFVTPSCRYCPAVARLAHKVAIENRYVAADVIEVTEFPQFAQRYAIRGVPKTVINETVEFVGDVPEPQFLEHVQRASSLPEAKL